LLDLNNLKRNKLTIRIKNIIWKAFDTNYNQGLIIKNNELSNEILNIEYKLNVPSYKIKNEIEEVYESDIKMLINVFSIKFIMLMKCIKEVTIFLEQNTNCLDENLDESDRIKMKDIKEDEELMIKLILHNSQIILPENSYSANYVYMSLDKAIIFIKNINEVPKIMMNLTEDLNPLLIIDKKFTFNVNSILADNTDLVPNSKIEVIGLNVNIAFYINNQIDKLGEFSKFTLILRSPKKGDIFHFRVDEWKKKYEKFCVVTMKPSMRFKIENADISTNIVSCHILNIILLIFVLFIM